MTNTASAPIPFIEKDTYAGRYVVRTAGKRSDVFTARELVEMFGAGKVAVLWEVNKLDASMAHRNRWIGQADGSMAGFNSDGVCVIIHPADRRIRVITK